VLFIHWGNHLLKRLKKNLNITMRFIASTVLILSFISCNRSEVKKDETTPIAAEKAIEILSALAPPEIKNDTVYLNPPSGNGHTHGFLNLTIDSISRNGGGVLVFRKGSHLLNGPIHLSSGVELHLEKDAVLIFSSNPEDYLPLVKVRWEGTVCYNYSPLIYGNDLENIAITGKGTIDGNGVQWSQEWRKRQKPDKKRLRQMGNDTIPEEQRVFGNGFLDLDGDGNDDGYGDGEQHYLRPTLIEFYECEKILIQGLTIKDSPFWTLHPVFSRNIIIRDLIVEGKTLNDDGIDPDSCEDVLIENCTIRTHDDAISIKAGRDQDAWNRPGSRNILVRNNRLESGVNAFCIGSEMSGGVSDIVVINNKISGGKHAVNFKCNLDRGGFVEQVYIDSMQIKNTRGAMVIFKMNYKGWRGNVFPTAFRDFTLSNIKCDSVQGPAFEIVGVDEKPIENVRIRNTTVNYASEASKVEKAENVVFEGVRVNGKVVAESKFMNE
jgi:polygalacturonase